MKQNSYESKLNLDLSDLNIDDYAKEKLNLNNQRIIKGTDLVVETPLIKNKTADEVISSWNKVFKKYSNSMNDVLIDIETNQKDKISPRSIALPWSERKESLYDYFNREQPDYTFKPKFNESGSLRPISLSNAVDYLKNNTAACLPSMLKTKDVKSKLKDNNYLNDCLSEHYPCVLFTRTQESKKTRNVWGYPKAEAVNEMRFYIPLQSEQKKLKWRKALVGPKETDIAITEMINFAVSNDKTLISIDFSSYDASVSKNQIDVAFDYIKSHFQKDYHDDIDKINFTFQNIGIVTPDGIIEGQHGIPSGSTFTNEVGSIVQYFMYEDINLSYMDYMQCQGDDGALVTDDENVDKLTSAVPKYGQGIKKEKCTFAKNWIVFLQNLYHIDYMINGIIGGIYPTYRALCRLMYQERWSDFEKYGISGQDYYSIRTIQILENCKFHPLFPEFVKFIYNLDKYNLRYTDEGLSKYVSMIYDKQGRSGIVDNQYGDDLGGIQNFESLKLIHKLQQYA